ncbi:chemotaxis protein CheY [Thiohalorhabdus denitrificans]|uniref:Phosphate regulon transcriptional regulatory protein PhoB n=1 Tax=Thiohalorhabdus denitrificans TaxID=381306 RepID=A0A0P9CRV5_9GAMM|nr:phosphate regulon transcriptional regulator PhoB [Thiohalorhabdus denitrificans]KPV39390.1 chemotaxis protein CheY [Thiohalorhabdus denitrificans]SCY67279.1 two component transcriptional regulator, winged helix family [Thiohalorhabdus denitrificans]
MTSPFPASAGPIRILVVEDEEPIQVLVQHNLEAAGFRVEVAADAETALERMAEAPPHLAILDWMLPGMSGLDLCRHMRGEGAYRHIPVIMLTAKGEEEHRVRGLEMGADDYLPKPFSPRELTARVTNLLRRSYPELQEEVLTAGELRLFPAQHRVLYGDREIHLGPTEFRLLQFLMTHPGQVFERGQLLDRLWGPYAEVEERTVDVHIRRLRRALDPVAPRDLVQTVRGAGYRFNAS